MVSQAGHVTNAIAHNNAQLPSTRVRDPAGDGFFDAFKPDADSAATADKRTPARTKAARKKASACMTDRARTVAAARCEEGRGAD